MRCRFEHFLIFLSVHLCVYLCIGVFVFSVCVHLFVCLFVSVPCVHVLLFIIENVSYEKKFLSDHVVNYCSNNIISSRINNIDFVDNAFNGTDGK